MKAINVLTLLFPLSLIFNQAGTSVNKSNLNLAESKVIFFSGTRCSSECYISNDPGKQCVWFTISGQGMQYADLSLLTTTYREKGPCRWVGGREHGTEECEYYTREMKWNNQIRSLYIGFPDLIVDLWEKPNFEGAGIRLSGVGCTDLTRSGWGDRARSFKIYFK